MQTNYAGFLLVQTNYAVPPGWFLLVPSGADQLRWLVLLVQILLLVLLLVQTNYALVAVVLLVVSFW